MFFVIGAGILISLFTLWTCLSVPDVGFPIWIVLMIIFWVCIPIIGTKYYESDLYKYRHEKMLRKLYAKNPNSAYCPKCLSPLRNSICFVYDDTALTDLAVYRCSNCGNYYTALRNRNPAITKPMELKNITKEEADEYYRKHHR